MPCCSVLSCRNHSGSISKNAGVSYHRYPKDPDIKEKWMEATGRINWFPTKWTTICSEHFAEDIFLLSNKGMRFLKSTAIPTLKIVKSFSEEHTNDSNIRDVHASSSKRKGGSLTPSRSSHKKKKSAVDETKDIVTTDRERKLEARLKFCENKVRTLILKVKRLHSNNVRLKKKISDMGFKSQEVLNIF